LLPNVAREIYRTNPTGLASVGEFRGWSLSARLLADLASCARLMIGAPHMVRHASGFVQMKPCRPRSPA